MKIFPIVLSIVLIAISTEKCISEYLLVEVDKTDTRGIIDFLLRAFCPKNFSFPLCFVGEDNIGNTHIQLMHIEKEVEHKRAIFLS